MWGRIHAYVFSSRELQYQPTSMTCVQQLTLFSSITLPFYKTRLPLLERRVIKKAIDVKFMLRYHQEDSKTSACKHSSSKGKAHTFTYVHNFHILDNTDF